MPMDTCKNNFEQCLETHYEYQSTEGKSCKDREGKPMLHKWETFTVHITDHTRWDVRYNRKQDRATEKC